MRGAIVDLDGTVYRGGSLLPGAAEGVERLRNAGLDVLFFSNNPIEDGTAYAASLTELGIPVSPAEACSAGVVTAAYLREHRADVLVASWTPEFDYDDMQAALDAVDEGTAFLGTDPDRTFPTEDGFVPGSGAITGAVAAVVGRDPDAVLGKPSDAALEFALDRLGAPPEECLVVGDRLDTDLAMGDRAGMTTVLVLTGVADREDLADSDVRPDYVIDRLGDVGSVLDDLARG
ncbi:HAD family hydrolase [Halobacteriales archaeon QH_2_65_14]|nr:MAG: HAD family hydrolase [Halobacteriales archaeon QH_2_65_14]